MIVAYNINHKLSPLIKIGAELFQWLQRLSVRAIKLRYDL